MLEQRLNETTDTAQPRIGCELEGWLLAPSGHPAAANEQLIAQLDDPRVVPELARFNLEVNTTPQPLAGDGLGKLHAELSQSWANIQRSADTLGLSATAIGILPAARPSDFGPDNMSAQRRYQALNEQVLRLRGGAPLVLDIDGQEPLHLEHGDVMLEAAATSFQIHLAVPANMAVRVFNAAKIVSAVTVAMNSNSPLLFGHRLWAETRIPLFEQAVSVGGSDYGSRVTFGIRYLEDSLMEAFDANLMRYPVLLPILDEDPTPLAALRLHNGTIWRWNRPLVNLSDSGNVEFRIEHRVTAAGPSLIDNFASMAFFLGLVWALATRDKPPEDELPFAVARENFYNAARHGMDASVIWLDGGQVQIADLVESRLIALAADGLAAAGCTNSTASRFLDVMADRAALRQSGSGWLLSAYQKLGDEIAVTRAYQQQQQSGAPVHQWDPV